MTSAANFGATSPPAPSIVKSETCHKLVTHSFWEDVDTDSKFFGDTLMFMFMPLTSNGSSCELSPD